jgi:hypothetical protein
MNKAITTLLNSGNPALILFTKRDLLGEDVNIEQLWTLPRVKTLLKHQQPNGSWLYPNKNAILRSPTNYNQYQTYKAVAELVECYGLNNKSDAVRNAAKYLFSFQTPQGDFRGLYGNQYSPNYSASITEFLIKAGYTGRRITNSLHWLLELRQDDGGWAIPFRTRNEKLDALNQKNTLEPDTTKPFSHLITGIVLRPFSLLSAYRGTVKAAGLLLAERVFTRDTYSDRRGVEYWTKFTYPYRWTDILSTIDALTRLDITHHPKINDIKRWFTKQKHDDGTYNVNVMAGAKYKDVKYWITLQYLRVLQRCYR